LLADKLRIRRLKNQIKIFSDAKKIAEENNISIKQINLKTLVPLLEFSSLEEDETLQKKWSNLIVNFSDVNEKYESSIFPFILNQLTVEDVRIIERFYSSGRGSAIPSGIIQSNLLRLGLIEIFNPTRTIFLNSSKNKIPTTAKYWLSELGTHFYECFSNKYN